MNNQQNFPVQIHLFYNWNTTSTLIGDDLIRHLLLIDDQDDVEDFILKENNKPRETQAVLMDLFKINTECLNSTSINPYNESIQIVDIIKTNAGLLSKDELLKITRISDFQNAYPDLFSWILKKLSQG